MRRQLTIIVHGDVQGVFFRYSAKEIARQLNITGYACNKPDGTVEIVAEGEEKNLKKLLEWARQGPAFARVKKCVDLWSEASDKFDRFEIR